MSAIAGIYNLKQVPIPTGYSQVMMDNLAQFPHNDLQVWNNKHVFLGCLQQWVTPESINEKLPYYDSERNVGITADAIIDNREELFSKLDINKDVQHSMSDSELILLAYLKWGEESPKYLIGDFAYMIWDENKQKLFGARDFSGTRTLYYLTQQETFAFCTVITPLLNLSIVPSKINEDWLAQYLAISSVVDAVDTNITPYQHILQVPPSHSITVENNKVKLNRYHSFDFKSKLKLKNQEEYIEAFHEVFQKAVSSRLRTYKKVGSHLSGGLDSGSVVDLVQKLLNKKIKHYIRLVMYHYQTLRIIHLNALWLMKVHL